MRYEPFALLLIACGNTESGVDAAAEAATPSRCFFEAGAICVTATPSNVVLTSVCHSFDASIATGECPAGHVGCCEVGTAPFGVTECIYPPLDVDAAAAICATVDGGFDAN